MTEQGEQKEFESIEEQCASLFDVVHVPTIVAHPGSTRIEYANSHFRNLLKLHQVDETIEKLSDMVKRGSFTDLREEMIEALKEPETPRTTIIELTEKLFTQESQHVVLSVLNFHDQEYVSIGFVENEITTDSKSLSKNAVHASRQDKITSLKKRIDELEKLCVEKDTIYNRFAHTIGHELKSPLTAIKGYTELLDYDFEQRDDPETKNILKMIIKTTERLSAYIESMYRLSLQDFQSKRYKVADVHQIFIGVRDELISLCEKTQSNIVFDEVKARIKVNPILLREILYQLILSELLYVKVPQTSIQLYYQQKDSKYYFAVVHQINSVESQNPNISEIVDQYDASKNENKSTTIGYEFSRKMIEQSNGKIVIERTEDGMNTFYFFLPQL